jgi:N-acyl-phosphatidylethanolamine-hydrolysing phospholipase D
MRRALVAFAVLAACATPSAAQDPAPSASAESLYAPHGGPGGFFNPWERFEPSVLRFLRWQLLSRNAYDKRRAPSVARLANDGAYLGGTEHSATLTWVGHASFAIHDGDDVVLTDPHFGGRALFPKRIVPPGIPLESVPADAFAVVSHDHYDHLDAETVERLPAGVAWYVPRGLGAWFRERGRDRVVELDWWESARRGRWTVTCLPSQHWSRRIENGTNSTLWCSWLLDSGELRYYFAGDTGWFHGFREFGRRFAPIDVALLPIGAYEPRWFMRYQHMDPAEAWQAFLDLGARFLVPMHWGTFDLTDEPVDLPPKELERAIRERGGDASRARLLAIGERWKVPERPDEPARRGS